MIVFLLIVIALALVFGGDTVVALFKTALLVCGVGILALLVTLGAIAL